MNSTATAQVVRPVKARRSPVIDSTYGRNNGHVLGYTSRITMSDGSDRYCDHVHTSVAALTRCAQSMVNAANASAQKGIS
jgi:hypothetical protein